MLALVCQQLLAGDSSPYRCSGTEERGDSHRDAVVPGLSSGDPLLGGGKNIVSTANLFLPSVHSLPAHTGGIFPWHDFVAVMSARYSEEIFQNAIQSQ